MALKLIAKRKKAKTDSQENVRKNYPWAIADSVRYDEGLKRYQYDVKCVKCGKVHPRFAQDLSETKGFCDACKKEREKAEKAEKDKLMAKAMKLLEAGEITLDTENAS
jgi:hypothetical protein